MRGWNRTIAVWGGVAATLATSDIARAQFALQALGTLPGDNYSAVFAVSGDGTFAVGESVFSLSGATHPFRWTSGTGMVHLGTLPGQSYGGSAWATSFDGSVVVGGAEFTAWRWTSGAGMANLGTLPGGTQSIAFGVSSDGSVVVGQSNAGPVSSPDRAFRWTPGTGMVDLGVAPGFTQSQARAASGDGSALVINNWNQDPTQGRVFRWTEQTGMVDIGTLPGQLYAEARSMSLDGQVIVGTSRGGAGGSRAFRWSTQTGMIDLGPGPATATNADGSVVVGDDFYWSQSTGRLGFRNLLEMLGLSVSPWQNGPAPRGVSADGNVVVGLGQLQGVGGRGFVAVVPAPGTLLLATGLMPLLGRGRRPPLPNIAVVDAEGEGIQVVP